MKSVIALPLVLAALLSACVSQEPFKPATPQQFNEAQNAVSICGRHAPDWDAISNALNEVGYTATENPRFISIQKSQAAEILEKQETGVVVLLGSRGREGACIVGLEGMSPPQGLELAQSWVKRFAALTNAERGQGLARNVVQAWGAKDKERIVYIAAYNSWDVIENRGAAARLLYIRK